MARQTSVRILGLGLLGVSFVACGGPAVDEVEAPALSANALSANALSANALSANALTAKALRDPLARQFLKYVVSCALDDKDEIKMTIDGVKYTFPGGLGLATEWGERGGRCDGECQRWVSACVLARVDYLGVEKIISVRGDHKALKTTGRERNDFPVREATYFGNLFIEGQPKFACLSPGQKEIERVCGDDLDNCPMDVVGSCARACAWENSAGGFVDCSSSGKARRPEVFHESVTVFLPKSCR